MSKLRIQKVAIAVMALALCFAVNIHAAAKKILWYGNSYSEAGRQYDMLPKMVNCDTCGISSGITMTTEPHMFPGCDLTCLEGDGALTSIDTGHYDFVMAADGHVAGWFWMWYDTQKNPNADQLTKWATHAKNAGGKLVIVQEWVQLSTPPHPDFTQTRSDFWYDSVARATKSVLSPEGRAWWYAYRINPNLEYIDINWNDGCHPGRFGAYLNICCQFAAITGKSPVGHKFRSINCYGTVEQLPADQALFAQQQAWDAYQFFNSSTPVTAPIAGLRTTKSALRALYSYALNTVTVLGQEIHALQVIGLDGRQVKTHYSNASAVTLLERLSSGVYMVRALCGDTWQTTTLRIGD